ncbi:MAG: ACP S-malonyltransferase [Pseudomonadota bacterium]|nr:ACP S-malonyltransferase [Pseudomonadota bacterium]
MTNKIAFVFPGQGSQSVGMLQALADEYSVVKDTFAEASDAVKSDLWRLVSKGPKELLDRTENTQPAMLAAGVAVWRVWNDCGGPQPARMAGHSLGELTALVCAGSLGYADAARVVAVRGSLMQEAVPEGSGAMAAILGLTDDQVRELCVDSAEGQVLEAVNFNAPGQVVIAGDAQAVTRAIQASKAAGAKRALPLPVSVPSHCALMRPAADRFRSELETLEVAEPAIPVLHNVSVEEAPDPSQIRSLLVKQLYSPVRWVETVRRLADEGVATVVEAGPGKVLAGLVRRIDKQMEALTVFDPAGLAKALEVTGDA